MGAVVTPLPVRETTILTHADTSTFCSQQIIHDWVLPQQKAPALQDLKTGFYVTLYPRSETALGKRSIEKSRDTVGEKVRGEGGGLRS